MLLAAALAGGASVGAGERPDIDPRVREATRQGEARIIVEVRTPRGVMPEGRLGGEAVDAQREAIAAAQALVLTRLAGTHFSLVHRYRTVPFLALVIGPDALVALEGMSDVVARVREDSAVAPRRAPERSPSPPPHR